MGEDALLELAMEGVGVVIALVSTAFGIISAYIAGLFFFLRRAPFTLRFAAFGLLSVTLAFMGLLALGLLGILGGADEAWRALESTVSGVNSLGGERPEILFGLSVYEAGAGLGFGSFALVYLMLAYMTFFYRWPETNA